MTPDEIDSLIKTQLAALGSRLTVNDIRMAMSESKGGIEQDNVSHGQDRHKPFWNYVSDDSVSVFAVFTLQSVAFYFVQHPLTELTPLTDPIAMDDVRAIERILTEHLGKNGPDGSVERGHAEFWMK